MTSPSVGRQTPAANLEPGVPQTLAISRDARVADLRYDLSFTIPTARADAIAGRVRVTFTLKDAAAPLALDFEPNRDGAVHRVEANGASVAPSLVSGHIVISPSALRAGANTVAIDFTAG